MESRPQDGHHRSEPDAAAADSKVIQYPGGGRSSPEAAPNDRPPGGGRSPAVSGADVAAAERNAEEWRVIRAVRQGDLIEFSILVNRYQKPIFHLMLRLTGRNERAEDLTQEVFTRAYEKLNTFRKGGRFFSWLYTIAANMGRDYLRKKGLRTDLFSAESFDASMADPNQDDCAKRADCVAQIRQIGEAMNLLPQRYSETLLLYYREGMTAREIAAALNISTAAVKVRVHRGRKMLQQKIGGRDE